MSVDPTGVVRDSTLHAQVPAWLLVAPDVNPSAIVAYAHLWLLAEDWHAALPKTKRTTQQELEDLTGWSTSTVARAVKSLERAGAVSREKHVAYVGDGPPLVSWVFRLHHKKPTGQNRRVGAGSVNSDSAESQFWVAPASNLTALKRSRPSSSDPSPNRCVHRWAELGGGMRRCAKCGFDG